jgi:hypothetical protein
MEFWFPVILGFLCGGIIGGLCFYGRGWIEGYNYGRLRPDG